MVNVCGVLPSPIGFPSQTSAACASVGEVVTLISSCVPVVIVAHETSDRSSGERRRTRIPRGYARGYALRENESSIHDRLAICGSFEELSAATAGCTSCPG